MQHKSKVPHHPKKHKMGSGEKVGGNQNITEKGAEVYNLQYFIADRVIVYPNYSKHFLLFKLYFTNQS